MFLKLLVHSSKSSQTRTNRVTVKFIPLYLEGGQGNNNNISNYLGYV